MDTATTIKVVRLNIEIFLPSEKYEILCAILCFLPHGKLIRLISLLVSQETREDIPCKHKSYLGMISTGNQCSVLVMSYGSAESKQYFMVCTNVIINYLSYYGRINQWCTCDQDNTVLLLLLFSCPQTCKFCLHFQHCTIQQYCAVGGRHILTLIVAIFPAHPVCVYVGTGVAGGFCWKMNLWNRICWLHITLVTCLCTCTHVQAQNGKLCR